MNFTISDPDVYALAMISGTLQADYLADEIQWLGSPFAWIKARPSRQIGAIGERLVAGWLAAKNFDVIRSPDSDADRLINGHRVEIKFSTLWKSGIYKFQQLRDQNYAYAICLGISPFDAHCWIIPKTELMTRWQASIRLGHDVDGLQPQHGGASGRDTAWLSIDPSSPAASFIKYGGRLSEAIAFFKKHARR